MAKERSGKVVRGGKRSRLSEVPRSVRLTAELERNVARTARMVGLRLPDTIRQALAIGLPMLAQMLGKRNGG